MAHTPSEITPFIHQEVVSVEDIDLDILDDPPTFESAFDGIQCDDIPQAETEAETAEEKADKRKMKGRDPKHFRDQRERKRQAGKVTMLKFMDAIATGVSIREAAKIVGVHPDYALQYLWPKLKAIALTDWSSPEERERIADVILSGMLHVLQVSRDNVAQHAAYGAVYISAAKELLQALGIDLSGKASGGDKPEDLEVLAEEIRGAMPALMGHHEHIAKIKERQIQGRLEREGVARAMKAE